VARVFDHRIVRPNGEVRHVRELGDTISITSVNEALLRIHGAESADEFIQIEQDNVEWWDEEWVQLYASEIANLASPRKVHDA